MELDRLFNATNVQVNASCNCTVELYRNQIKILKDGAVQSTIRLSDMSGIEVHQPIFGANYITAEFTNHDAGSKQSLTMTFNGGGATEFARVFFRVTEGQLVSTETTQIHQQEPAQEPAPQSSAENKKTV